MKKYSKIQNLNQKKFLSRVLEEYGDDRFVAVNKIDGANISIIYDGNEFSLARRKEKIQPDENFNHCWNVCPKYFDAVKSMYKCVCDPGDTLQVYGEICGGIYPHPDVQKSNNAKKIQGRVFYNPNIDVVFFDIAKNGDYFPYDYSDRMFVEYDLPRAYVFGHGNLKEMLEIDVENLPDPTHKIWNLPRIENNFTEGVVIRPQFREIYIEYTRVILKKKAQSFSEKRKKPAKRSVTLTDEENNFMQIVGEYITESRLISVLSKDFDSSDVTFKNFGKIVGMFQKDILEDFSQENDVDYKSFENYKEIKKKLKHEVQDAVRKYLKEDQ